MDIIAHPNNACVVGVLPLATNAVAKAFLPKAKNSQGHLNLLT